MGYKSYRVQTGKMMAESAGARFNPRQLSTDARF